MSVNINEQHLSAVISNRHSVRAYDPEYKMTESEIKEILQEASLAPSSSNLQPWRFLVVTDPEVKQQLHPVAFNQQSILDSSAVIVLLGDLEAYKNADKIHSIFDEETSARLTDGVNKTYSNLDAQKRKEVALVDGGLVAMQIMLVAKAKGYDTLPMGGYSEEKLMELFQIPERYTSVMLIALGKATKEAFTTSRLPVEDTTFFNHFL